MDQLKQDKPHQYAMMMKHMKKNQWYISATGLLIIDESPNC